MNLAVKAVLAFSILMILTSEVYSRCLEYDDSFKKHVLKARELVQNGYFQKAASAYKNHLICWEDEEVAIELGELYESQDKYYLAGLAYKEAGALKKLEQLKQKRLTKIEPSGNDKFQYLAKQDSVKYLKKHKDSRITANVMFFLGSAITTAGLGLFIHDKTTGENPLAAQYSLIIGGLTIVNIGILLNTISHYSLNISNSYQDFSGKNTGDTGTTPYEFYNSSGAIYISQKNSAKIFKQNGAIMLLVSIPLIAIPVYGFYESYQTIYDREHDDESDGGLDLSGLAIGFTHLMQIFTLVPGFASIISGLIILAKGSIWETQSTEPNLLTLNSITPIINPVSKTYGLALGFSF